MLALAVADYRCARRPRASTDKAASRFPPFDCRAATEAARAKIPRMTQDSKHGLARGLTNYGDPAFSLYLRRSFAKSMGYSGEMLARPVVGIADSKSGFNNCHRHFPELIEAVKRGVIAAGGLPIDFPTRMRIRNPCRTRTACISSPCRARP